MTGINIQMELTNHCNLKCFECPNRLMKRERLYMRIPVFERIIEIAKTLNPWTMILHKDGEPLMHPDFKAYFARITESLGSKIDIYTNGFYLTPELVEYVSETGKNNQIWFLITFHFFDHNKQPYNYDKIEQRILESVKLNKPNVKFVISTHKTDATDDIKSKSWYIKWANIAGENKNIYGVHLNTSINPWAGLIKQEQEMAHFYACPYNDAQHLFIGVTGNVLPCCMDLEEEVVFGNIMEEPFESIMAKRQIFYTELREKTERALCLRCLE